MGGLGDVLGLSPVKRVTKLTKVVIDNPVFQLHTKATVCILVVASITISSKQFFGEPIRCIHNIDNEKSMLEALNAYCWMNGTFTLKNPNSGINGKYRFQPGVGPHQAKDEEIYHKYYQWVCLILLIQAAMFYFPYYLWKKWEGGKLQFLSSEIDATKFLTKEWTDERKFKLVTYFKKSRGHLFYALRFAFCELLNFLNVVMQFFLLNKFLGGTFSNYGPAVALFLYDPTASNFENPMAWAFPKITKCTFPYIGNSGSLQILDLLCVLPLNIVNEKLFAFIWFWFVFLMIISAVSILYRVVVFCCPCARGYIMLGMIDTIPRYEVMNIFNKFDIGTWFTLFQLSKNINPLILRELVLELDMETDKSMAMI